MAARGGKSDCALRLVDSRLGNVLHDLYNAAFAETKRLHDTIIEHPASGLLTWINGPYDATRNFDRYKPCTIRGDWHRNCGSIVAYTMLG